VKSEPEAPAHICEGRAQKLAGTAEMAAFGRGGPAEKVEIEDGKVHGDNISFTVGACTGRENYFKGRVSGNTIEVSMTSNFDDYGTRPITFSAKRAQ